MGDAKRALGRKELKNALFHNDFWGKERPPWRKTDKKGRKREICDKNGKRIIVDNSVDKRGKKGVKKE